MLGFIYNYDENSNFSKEAFCKKNVLNNPIVSLPIRFQQQIKKYFQNSGLNLLLLFPKIIVFHLLAENLLYLHRESTFLGAPLSPVSNQSRKSYVRTRIECNALCVCTAPFLFLGSHATFTRARSRAFLNAFLSSLDGISHRKVVSFQKEERKL